MNLMTIVVSLVSILGTISSIVFAYITFKRNSLNEQKEIGIKQGSMSSKLEHIKTCVDRMEKHLSVVDDRYKDILVRLTKLEEAVSVLKGG